MDDTGEETRRDIATDLNEITERLGEPDATFRTNPRSVAWRFSLGVAMVVAAVLLHFLLWTGEIPWPNFKHFKIWILLFLGGVIGPGAGLYVIAFAIGGMKMWVLAYPTGLFVWHRGRVLAFPWDDVTELRLAGLPDKAVLERPDGPDGLPIAYYDLTRSGRRVFGTTITLVRADGEEIALPSTLENFADLGRRAQEETYARLFPTFCQRFRAGYSLPFGPMAIERDSLSVGTASITWGGVDGLERKADKLEVKEILKKKPFAKCDLSEVANPHILMGLVSAIRAGLLTADVEED